MKKKQSESLLLLLDQLMDKLPQPAETIDISDEPIPVSTVEEIPTEYIDDTPGDFRRKPPKKWKK